jgi:putative molybdenum carrier protein
MLKIVSGGQTGVDRAALDVALTHGIAHGGWCPRGRRAEDGRIPDRYLLREHAAPEYAARTEQNVVDSDATLVLAQGTLGEGTSLTVRMAERHGRPCSIVDLDDPPAPTAVVAWLVGHAVRVLNVAGPRESTHPGIHDRAVAYLERILPAAVHRG